MAADTDSFQEMLPELRRRRPGVRLHIVGRNPAPDVRALAGEAVDVTGTVPDVRPYLQHAAVVVAPLRVARGIQNKILEAMAMSRPVVTSPSCGTALEARIGEHLLTAETAQDYVQAVSTLLDDAARGEAIGVAGRRRVVETYSWAGSLRVLDERLAEALRGRSAPVAASALAAVAPAERS